MGLVFFGDGHVHEVLVVAFEDVDVHIAVDAIDFAYVGVLPECPFAFVLEGVDVVVGYPVGVFVELGGVEVGGAELVAGVEDGCDAVVLFDVVHPLEHLMPQLGGGAVAEFLDVEHGGKVVLVELDELAEVLGLVPAWRGGAEVVVGSAHDVVLLGVVEVLVEVLVPDAGAFGGFDEDEGDGHALYLCVAQFVPVDVALIVGDVEASHLAVGIDDMSVECFPTERVWTNEGVVEEGDVGNDNDAKRSP